MLWCNAFFVCLFLYTFFFGSNYLKRAVWERIFLTFNFVREINYGAARGVQKICCLSNCVMKCLISIRVRSRVISKGFAVNKSCGWKGAWTSGWSRLMTKANEYRRELERRKKSLKRKQINVLFMRARETAFLFSFIKTREVCFFYEISFMRLCISFSLSHPRRGWLSTLFFNSSIFGNYSLFRCYHNANIR